MRVSSRIARATVGAVALALVLTACGDSDDDVSEASAASDSSQLSAGAEAEAGASAGAEADVSAAGDAGALADKAAGAADAAGKAAKSAKEGKAAEKAGTVAAGLLTALPELQVVDVNTGEKANLQTFAKAGVPTLLWFWAPHCTLCRAEAPDMKAFASKYAGKVQVLGVGAQDDYEQAKGFIADTGTQNITMIWDSSGKSWIHFKVTNQPTVIVLDAEGKVQGTWFREFNEDKIIKAAGV